CLSLSLCLFSICKPPLSLPLYYPGIHSGSKFSFTHTHMLTHTHTDTHTHTRTHTHIYILKQWSHFTTLHIQWCRGNIQESDESYTPISTHTHTHTHTHTLSPNTPAHSTQPTMCVYI